jgi:predicted transcriptional regulator
MREDSQAVDVDDSIMHVAKLFADQEFAYYRGFPVMKNNRVVGRIILRDVLRAIEVMSEDA